MLRRLCVISNKGFTLIEMMIAIFIIMISMLAYLNTMLISMRTSLDNDIRDTATRVANQTGEALLALSLKKANDCDVELTSAPAPGVLHTRVDTDVVQTGKGLPNTMQLVRGALQSYTINWTATTLTDKSIQIDISVQYTSRNTTFIKNSVLYKYSTI